MIPTKKVLLVILGLSLAGMVEASGGKNDIPLLHGYVMDALTKKPVAGVLVSASLPGSVNSQEVTTDAEGYFHFAQLPTSPINLQFEKKGYQSFKRNGILIKEKTTIKLNIEFLPDEGERSEDDSEYPLLRMIEMN